MILPASQEAESPYWRPIKYPLFPPLGLTILAAYFRDDDQVENIPPVRRDLIKREKYFVPNSLVVSRGRPHHNGYIPHPYTISRHPLVSTDATGRTYYIL